MYSEQFAFGVPNDFPQGSTHDGVPRRRNTCSLDSPILTRSYPAVIREFPIETPSESHCYHPNARQQENNRFLFHVGSTKGRHHTDSTHIELQSTGAKSPLHQ